MPKRKAPVKKKTIAEADSNGDTTDSAVAVARADPAPPPTKKTKVAVERTKGNNGKSSSQYIQWLMKCLIVVTKAVRIIAEADSTPADYTSERVGIVMTLGQGDCGQLGLGDAMTERKKPFPVAGQLEGFKIVQVECGGMHTVVLTDDGKVRYCPISDLI